MSAEQPPRGRKPQGRKPAKRAPARRTGRPETDWDDIARLVLALAVVAVALGVIQQHGAQWRDSADTWLHERAAAAGIGHATVVPPRRAVSGPQVERATAQLDGLPAAAGGATPYDRDRFGPAWADVDRNGCDTRNDVLARDMEDVARRGPCVVVSGTLRDPYTGKTIEWTKAKASAVQIDHVVALSEAWKSGAWRWPPDRRRQIANDPRNLLAVDGPENQRKSDDDPAEWLPPAKGYVCAYVVRYVGVKAAYGLGVDKAERAALRDTLARCA